MGVGVGAGEGECAWKRVWVWVRVWASVFDNVVVEWERHDLKHKLTYTNKERGQAQRNVTIEQFVVGSPL